MRPANATIVTIFVIAIIAIPLFLLLSNTDKQTLISKQQPTPVATSPTPQPLSSSSADAELSSVDASITASLTQLDTDVQSISQINSTQDSTTGL